MQEHQKRVFVALGDKEDAGIAARTLLDIVASSAATPTYAFSVTLSHGAWDAAHAVGQSRTLIKKLRGRKPHEDRGADDARIDTEGALGELVLALVLEKTPGVLIAPLVAHKPDASGIDLKVDGVLLDVKTVGEPRSNVNVNQRAHLDKRPAGYVVVKVARADVADVFAVGADAVGDWRLTTCLRGVALDPRRFYYTAGLPRLAALPEETEV